LVIEDSKTVGLLLLVTIKYPKYLPCISVFIEITKHILKDKDLLYNFKINIEKIKKEIL